jgi:hypothetical protein
MSETKLGRGVIDTNNFSEENRRLLAFATEVVKEGDLGSDIDSRNWEPLRILAEQFNLPTNDMPSLVQRAVSLYDSVFPPENEF